MQDHSLAPLDSPPFNSDGHPKNGDKITDQGSKQALLSVRLSSGDHCSLLPTVFASSLNHYFIFSLGFFMGGVNVPDDVTI